MYSLKSIQFSNRTERFNLQLSLHPSYAKLKPEYISQPHYQADEIKSCK